MVGSNHFLVSYDIFHLLIEIVIKTASFLVLSCCIPCSVLESKTTIQSR